jgi:hypothetical protein
LTKKVILTEMEEQESTYGGRPCCLTALCTVRLLTRIYGLVTCWAEPSDVVWLHFLLLLCPQYAFYVFIEVPAAVTSTSTIFWDVTPCSPVESFRYYGSSDSKIIFVVCFSLVSSLDCYSNWRWRQLVSPNPRWTSNRLYGVKSQKDVNFHLTTLSASRPAFPKLEGRGKFFKCDIFNYIKIKNYKKWESEKTQQNYKRVINKASNLHWRGRQCHHHQ